MVPKNSIMLTSYQVSRRKIALMNGGVVDVTVTAGAGIVAGCAESFAVTPFEGTWNAMQL